MFLLVAVALGILATVLAFVFIQSGANADTGPKVHVLGAKHDISPNTPIDPDKDLKPVELSAKSAAAARQTIDWSARGSYKGLRVNREIQDNMRKCSGWI